MRKTTLFLLLVSSTFAVYNPYENASSPYYQELFSEFRSFVTKVTFANIKRKEKVRFKLETTSCVSTCGEERSHTFYCHCDENCQLTQDCCPDYLKTCKPNTISQQERDKWQCVSDLWYKTSIKRPWYDWSYNLPRIKGHAMISSCLNCPQKLQEDCSRELDSEIDAGKIPVEGPDGHTYKNKFCALGNGIKPEDIKTWGYELLCKKAKLYNETKKIQEIINCIQNESQNCLSQDREYLEINCIGYYAPPLNITKRHAVCSPVKTCPQTPDFNITALKYAELSQKCHAYMRVVFHSGTYYKNFHCALCYGIEPTDIQNPPIITWFPTIATFFEIRPQQKPNQKANIKNATNFTASAVNMSSSSSQKTKAALEKHIHLTGLSVSMVTLLFLLTLYLLVKELRTTPGKIIIGLSISILLYQTMLLASSQLTEHAVTCSITAICLHFAVLSSFAWMSVMSFDVWKTFGKNNQQQMKKNSSAFRYYCLYVFINPFVIVVVATALDRSGVMLVYWRDGESRTCWIVDNFSNILFFEIPVATSLGLNVIAFIWTIVGITNVRNVSGVNLHSLPF